MKLNKDDLRVLISSFELAVSRLRDSRMSQFWESPEEWEYELEVYDKDISNLKALLNTQETDK